MSGDSRSLLITDHTAAEIRDYLDRDKRLLVPVGACDQYGPHLPLGAATLVTESFALRLSEDTRVLRAPVLPYGVNVPAGTSFPGAAGVREKTLHSYVNDLLASWEDVGFAEFILLTAHTYDSHVEAVATVTGTCARIRVVELLNIDLSEFLSGGAGPEHGGEALTSLFLYLYPDRARMDRAIDYVPQNRSGSTLRRIPRIGEDSPGSIGRPTAASAETGRKIFDHICEKIRSRVFTAPD